MTRNKRCALSLRCDGDGELGVASSSTKGESFYGLHEKANTHHFVVLHAESEMNDLSFVSPRNNLLKLHCLLQSDRL